LTYPTTSGILEAKVNETTKGKAMGQENTERKTAPINEDDRLLTEDQVAEMLGLKVQTLRNHRHLRRGLPYVKFNSTVRYLRKDILATMQAHRIDPEARA
jgi:hypothetical protein